MSMFVLKIRDYLIDPLDTEIISIDDEERQELETLAANAIDTEYIPVYIYLRQYPNETWYIASTTNAWAWMVHHINENTDVDKLMQIGYERFTKNILVKWMGYAGFGKVEINGTLAWVLLRLIDKEYETLRIMSTP